MHPSCYLTDAQHSLAEKGVVFAQQQHEVGGSALQRSQGASNEPILHQTDFDPRAGAAVAAVHPVVWQEGPVLLGLSYRPRAAGRSGPLSEGLDGPERARPSGVDLLTMMLEMFCPGDVMLELVGLLQKTISVRFEKGE